MARTQISAIYHYMMSWWHQTLVTDRDGERGANLIEYSLLVAFIAAICFIAVGVVGRETASNISGVVSGL